jgi:predicted  nucleic acid-binding Zn-ribbon protein
MESAMTQSLLRYSDIRKSVSLLEQWKDSLRNRQNRIENELVAFRNALADKATHDGLNHEINELYADTVLENLIDKQQQWHTKINEWRQRQQSVYDNWNELNDSLLIWRQSIPKQNQPA